MIEIAINIIVVCLALLLALHYYKISLEDSIDRELDEEV
jgi:hypothetical protein